MPRGVKTDEQTKQKIYTSYSLTNSYNATAKELGISDTTVKTIIENNKEEFGKVKEQKKEEFSTRANKIIDKALVLLNRRYDTALENQDAIEELINQVMSAPESTTEDGHITRKEKIDIAKRLSRLELNSLSEITTSMGTLYDKMRLDKGESTTNQSIKVEMADELKELSK